MLSVLLDQPLMEDYTSKKLASISRVENWHLENKNKNAFLFLHLFIYVYQCVHTYAYAM